MGADGRKADHQDQDHGHRAGDGRGARARSRTGRRRHRLHVRAIGPQPYPRASPDMAVATDGRGTGRALSVLPAPRFNGAKAARLHRRGEDGAQSVMTGYSLRVKDGCAGHTTGASAVPQLPGDFARLPKSADFGPKGEMTDTRRGRQLRRPKSARYACLPTNPSLACTSISTRCWLQTWFSC